MEDNGEDGEMKHPIRYDRIKDRTVFFIVTIFSFRVWGTNLVSQSLGGNQGLERMGVRWNVPELQDTDVCT